MKQFITDFLFSQGLITEQQLKIALEKKKKSQKKLENILVELNYVSKSVMSEVLKNSDQKIFNDSFDQSLLNVLPSSFLRKHGLFPLRKSDGRLFFAVSDTQKFDLIDNMSFLLSDPFTLILCDAEAIAIAFQEAFSEKKSDQKSSTDKNFHFKKDQRQKKNVSINQFVDSIIQNAFLHRASDIHLEPFKNRMRLKYRVDGILYEMEDIPFDLKNSVISRIKLISGMDISEKRLPQDGKMSLSFKKEEFFLRVSCVPSLYGESLAMRVLDKNKGSLQFNQLGFLKEDEELLKKMIHLSNGLILLSGPTGSGKTTTMYTLINKFNALSQKIITIEDPVEYQLSGISQVSVNTKIDLTFPKILKSVLRQTPNVIMIGEIRDVETASIAVQASLTGHLVLSTLHTDTATSSVVRLFDMGVFPYKIASALRAVIAQRLIRSLCNNCKKETKLSCEEKKLFSFMSICPEKIFIPQGCQHCLETGYWGRLGIFQIMFIDDVIRESIYKKNVEYLIEKHLRQKNISNLWEDGLKKVALGLTSIHEVKRVFHKEDSVEK